MRVSRLTRSSEATSIIERSEDASLKWKEMTTMLKILFIIIQFVFIVYGILMLFVPRKVLDWNNSQLVNKNRELYPLEKLSVFLQKKREGRKYYLFQVRLSGFLLIIMCVVFIYGTLRSIRI